MRRRIYSNFILIMLTMCFICACNRNGENIKNSIYDMTENVGTKKVVVDKYDMKEELSNQNNNYDDNLIMYYQNIGFVNKQGKVFRLEDNQVCDYKFNVIQMREEFDEDEKCIYGEYAIISVFDKDEQNIKLYYLDSQIEPVLLSVQDKGTYYGILYASDISADGNWILYPEYHELTENKGYSQSFDVHLYCVKDNTDIVIGSNVLNARFTLDGKYIVYSELSQESNDKENKKFKIVDLENNKVIKSFNENDYDGIIGCTGLWSIRDNGDILIFKGMMQEDTCASAIYLIREDKLYTLFDGGSDRFNIVANQNIDEVFWIEGDNIFYYSVDKMKCVNLGKGYNINIPAISKRKNIVYNIETLDKMVFTSKDGVYAWNAKTFELEKILSMNWSSDDITLINYYEYDAVIALDKNKVCRIDNISSEPVITTLFSIANGKITDTMYYISLSQSLDDNIWFIVEEGEDSYLYSIDKNGDVEHVISTSIIWNLNFSDIVYAASADKYILMVNGYNSEYLYSEYLYAVDSNLEILKCIEERGVYDIYSSLIWLTYELTDGTVCMYNGDRIIDIGMIQIE